MARMRKSLVGKRFDLDELQADNCVRSYFFEALGLQICSCISISVFGLET